MKTFGNLNSALYVFDILAADLPEHVMRLCKAYKTDVLSMTMMGETVVFLNTYELIKEYFQKRKYLQDRPFETGIFKIFDEDVHGKTS